MCDNFASQEAKLRMAFYTEGLLQVNPFQILMLIPFLLNVEILLENLDRLALWTGCFPICTFSTKLQGVKVQKMCHHCGSVL